MKIELNLNNSINNYHWKNNEELKDYIDNYMLEQLWTLYNADLLDDDLQNRLYDILDMFSDYKIKESELK